MNKAYIDIVKKEMALISSEWVLVECRIRKAYLHNLWQELEIKLEVEK